MTEFSFKAGSSFIDFSVLKLRLKFDTFISLSEDFMFDPWLLVDVRGVKKFSIFLLSYGSKSLSLSYWIFLFMF